MTNLANFVKDKFDGMLVVGDIHGDFEYMLRAVKYAEHENYFFMSLGDLVDRGPNPYETVELMHDLVMRGAGGFVVGNHDNKFSRYAKGAKVQLSYDAKDTLESVGTDRIIKFLKMYVEIVEHPTMSAFFHKFGDISLVHAASHPYMWDDSVKFTKSVESRMIVGETNGEKYDDGYPVRLYTWIDEIPISKTVIVGHDKMPIHNINIVVPLEMTNKNGGKVVFLDTGCGKGGFLSGAIMTHDSGKFKLNDFVEFK